MLIDTHCHLNFPDYQGDLDQVIKNSVDNGVKKIICVSSNLGDSKKSIELAKKYPDIIYACVGIHPQQTDPENPDSAEEQLRQLEKLATQPETVAIGECGLDYSPAPPGEKDRTREEQYFLFENQIKLAKKLNLPLVFHPRKATEDFLEIIAEYTPLSGVWHCYTGGKSKIQKVIDFGLYFGIDGNLTYDLGLQNVVRLIPLEKIVLETDAPFLSTLPHRGLRNEPGNVKIIAEFLAESKTVSVEQICEITTDNAIQLFKLK